MRRGVGVKETKATCTAPVQRETDGDVQTTGANATGLKNKKSKTTGNLSAKTSTVAKLGVSRGPGT